MKTLLAAILVAALAGCTLGGNRSASAENDRLRARVVELEDQLAAARGERDELALRLQAAARAAPVAAAGAPHLPVVTSLNLGFGTGLAPDNGGYAVFYVQPFDGMRRFTQVAGELDLEIVDLGDSPMSDARTIGSMHVTADMLRAAYRSGIAGTFYELRVPLQTLAEIPRGASVVLRAALADASTGETHKAEKIVEKR